MPAAFLGHGSPMNALESNRYSLAWRAFGASLPRPRAILVISAHWYVEVAAVTAMPSPRTIHDFYGFPQELFDVLAKSQRLFLAGQPDVARELLEPLLLRLTKREASRKFFRQPRAVRPGIRARPSALSSEGRTRW